MALNFIYFDYTKTRLQRKIDIILHVIISVIFNRTSKMMYPLIKGAGRINKKCSFNVNKFYPV